MDTAKDLQDYQVLDSREVATIFKLSPKNGYRTVERLARIGKLKGRQVGDKWRFTWNQIRNFMEKE